MEEGRTLLKWTFAKYRMNLVNETNLVHDLFLVYFINFITSTCFGLSGMQERLLLHTRQSAIQNNKYRMSYKYSVLPDDGPREVRNM
jgi:hypothetical protein